MLQVILTVGIPSSGKSTWAKQHVAKDPTNWVRINNDMLRSMCNNTVYTADYEKLIVSTRVHMIKQALLMNKNVIVDNVNLGKRNFQEAINAALSSNVDVKIYEKPFYIPLDEALQRDSSRVGKEKVGEDIIRKFWKSSGGAQHKYYVPREEVFLKRTSTDPVEWDDKLPTAVVSDLDGTLQKNHGRSFYDATTCDQDLPNKPVIEMIKMCYEKGNHIIFMSGREDKYMEPTKKFFELHLPEVKYSLFMRKTDDQRKDSVVKLELYEEHIKGKFNVLCWYDDRNQVVQMVREQGIACFQVDYGDF